MANINVIASRSTIPNIGVIDTSKVPISPMSPMDAALRRYGLYDAKNAIKGFDYYYPRWQDKAKAIGAGVSMIPDRRAVAIGGAINIIGEIGDGNLIEAIISGMRPTSGRAAAIKKVGDKIDNIVDMLPPDRDHIDYEKYMQW